MRKYDWPLSTRPSIITALGNVVTLLLYAIGVLASETPSLEAIDESWQDLRLSCRPVQYSMEGTSFVAERAFGNEDGARMPSKSKTTPLHVAWVLDFGAGRVRREQSFPVFDGSHHGFNMRHAIDVYTMTERKTYTPAVKNKLKKGDPEFFVNRKSAYPEAWDRPLLLAYGYVANNEGGEGGTFTSLVKPLDTNRFTYAGERSVENRKVILLRTGAEIPGQPSIYEEYTVDPALGFRILTTRQWIRGQLYESLTLTYDHTADGVWFLKGYVLSQFDTSADQQRLTESIEMTTLQFTDEVATSFDLQPKDGMWVRDEATMTTYQFHKRAERSWLMYPILCGIAMLVASLWLWSRGRRTNHAASANQDSEELS